MQGAGVNSSKCKLRLVAGDGRANIVKAIEGFGRGGIELLEGDIQRMQRQQNELKAILADVRQVVRTLTQDINQGFVKPQRDQQLVV